MDGTRGGVIEANNFTPTASFGHGCYIWVVFDLLEIGHDVGAFGDGESIFILIIISNHYTVFHPTIEIITYVGCGRQRAGVAKTIFSATCNGACIGKVGADCDRVGVGRGEVYGVASKLVEILRTHTTGRNHKRLVMGVRHQTC